mgnify:CR=1 FL=1|tara:strand:- start:8116 stop:8559 length:444 start_codon:yes stop_codon:yes gene_type:complete
MIVIKSPFDLLNILGRPAYKEVANIDKKRNAFIVNRMLSRALPEVAMSMSHLKSVAESTVDFWNQVFVDFNKTPQGQNMLSYIRRVFRVSMAGAKKKTKAKIDKDLAKKYMIIAKMSQKEFNVLVEYYEKDLIKYLKKFQKMLETSK